MAVLLRTCSGRRRRTSSRTIFTTQPPLPCLQGRSGPFRWRWWRRRLAPRPTVDRRVRSTTAGAERGRRRRRNWQSGCGAAQKEERTRARRAKRAGTAPNIYGGRVRARHRALRIQRVRSQHHRGRRACAAGREPAPSRGTKAALARKLRGGRQRGIPLLARLLQVRLFRRTQRPDAGILSASILRQTRLMWQFNRPQLRPSLRQEALLQPGRALSGQLQEPRLVLGQSLRLPLVRHEAICEHARALDDTYNHKLSADHMRLNAN